MSDVNIAFCRALLRSATEEVRKHFPGIKVSEAAVLDSGFGQYLFEFEHEGERFAEYVQADNAYHAKAEGWHKFLAHKRIEGWY